MPKTPLARKPDPPVPEIAVPEPTTARFEPLLAAPMATLPLVVSIRRPQPAPVLPQNPTLLSSAMPTKARSAFGWS